MRLRLPPALAVASGIMLSRLTGLVRERVFAHYLGNSAAAGAFKAALRIPNLLQTLFGEGVLSASFIPVYARLMAEGKEREARALANAVLPFLFLVTAAIVALGVSFADVAVTLVAPGFTASARALTVLLVKVMFPGTGMLVLSAWCLGVLNSHRRFLLSYAAGVLWNAAIIAALVLGANLPLAAGSLPLDTLVVWAAWGTVVGAGLQFAVQLPLALRLNGGLGLHFGWRDAAFRQVTGNFGPAVVARGVVQVSAYIDQWLSSWLGPAIVSGLAYAQVLYLLPISLFGMSVSASELPEMSSATGTSAEILAAIKLRLDSALSRVTFFIVPASVAFIGLGDTVAATVLQSGHFDRGDARLVWGMLAALGLGLTASVWSRLLVSALWAMKETVVPMRIAILRLGLTALLGLAAVFPVRDYLHLTNEQAAAGLNGTMSLAAWCEFFLDRWVVGRRLGAKPVLWKGAALCTAVALVALGAGYLTRVAVDGVPPLAEGALVLGVFGVVYLAGTTAAGHPEPRRLVARVRARLTQPSSRP